MFIIILWMTLITIIDLLPEVLIPIGNGISLDHSNLYKWINATVPWVLSFLTFWGLYKFIPNTLVKWHYALWGAVFSSVIWNIATNIFSWVISSGIANYEKLYGSLGAVIAFLTWIYITATITLIGAHLSAAIAFVKDETTLPDDAKKELL
jgi:membrane protein